MRRVSPLQWVIAAIITVALGAASFVLTNGASIGDDAAQNLQMAINVSHYGVMSLDENPPYNRTMYREPLPVATSAAAVQIVDHFLGKADSAQYFSGDRAKYIKYQNTLWVILLWAAVLAATRWFTGSFWFSVGAGLLAVKPFLNGVAADGVNNLYTELPAAVLMICASFSFAFAVARGRTWPMVTVGLCFGILTLTKAATLYVFVGLVLVLLFSYARGETQPGRRPRFFPIIMLVGTFAIVVAPWIARNFQAFGRPVISDRGGFVLYSRALMNQVTPIEYRGSFYVWARPLLQPEVGSILGFSPRDLDLGGRLERLGGGVPGTAVYDHGRAAEIAGLPENTISFYHRARAERIRLERELARNHDPIPEVSADGMLQRKGMLLIKGDVWANLAMVVPLLWRSAPLIFPAMAFALGYCVWVKRYALALFILPGFATLSFYALATQFEPRPASIAHATAVVSTVTMLHSLWLWVHYRRRMATPPGRSSILEADHGSVGVCVMSKALPSALTSHREDPASLVPLTGTPDALSSPKLAARLEPFDSYWQAPADVDSGYKSFSAYYRANYLPHIPANRDAKILVISCGPGYLVDLLAQSGYRNVLGIDSDAAKVEHARRRGLPCEVAQVFPFLAGHQTAGYDCIIPEQELNHLTIDETIAFLQLCRSALCPGGSIIVYAMNGANPLVGSENLAHNIDHFYNLTEYSIGQLLHLGGFDNVRPFALKLYVFWKNPLNYVGLAVTSLLEAAMKVIFRLYGKKVRIVSKKIAAIAERSAPAA